MLGKLDWQTIELANEQGIDIEGGYIRTTDKRVVIGNKIFLTMGMKHRYVMRSRIVWWVNTGEFLTGGEWDIHHKNHNRIDDRFCNLEKLSHSDHSIEHHPGGTSEVVTRICKGCKKEFLIFKHRLKERGRGTFCSQKCYHSTPRTKVLKLAYQRAA